MAAAGCTVGYRRGPRRRKAGRGSLLLSTDAGSAVGVFSAKVFGTALYIKQHLTSCLENAIGRKRDSNKGAGRVQ